MDVHTLGDGVTSSHLTDYEMVSWRERSVDARGLFARSEWGCGARGHRSFLVEDNLHSIAQDPEMLNRQRDEDVQENELVARLLTPLLFPVVVVVSVSWYASTSRALTLQPVCIQAWVNLTWVMGPSRLVRVRG